MNRFFFGKLAVSNLKKNKGLYLPYLITAIGIGAVFYIMQAITGDPGIQEMQGADVLAMILGFGCGVVGIFAAIFLFYTNSFLMKRRKKEFGLFNILGMEKRHIGKMMFWESCILLVLCIAGGLLCGIVLNKLLVLVLLRLTHLEVPFGFSISLGAVRGTALLLAGIFAATLIFNLHQVQKAKPIELLQSASKGEAEPKTRWLMAVIGAAALAGGYWIAITTEDPTAAIGLFFVAVILVMIGTYCLFTAGSIAVLKLLRRNKKYYYQTSHFTSVSGMIYRMKQNAVGLANICILSTAVLVMLTGTVSMYAGMGDITHTRYPNDIEVQGSNLDQQQKDRLQALIKQGVSDSGQKIEEIMDVESLTVSALKKQDLFELGQVGAFTDGTVVMLEFMTADTYNRMTGSQEKLNEDEVLTYTQLGESLPNTFEIAGNSFRVKKDLDRFELAALGTMVVETHIIVVKDRDVLVLLDNAQKEAYGGNASNIDYKVQFSISGTQEDEIACADRITKEIRSQITDKLPQESNTWLREADSREEFRENSYVFYGGFLFLGMFLGLVFLMATVMIIYYKQVSEGYEDKGRFEIMQKVGMSHREIRASIRSQIINVFFLPLVMACIHLAAAFKLVERLLLLFGMTNTGLFIICNLITVAVFIFIYAAVYGVTAKAYDKIVGSK